MRWIKTEKNADFPPINRDISETIEYRHSYNGRLIGNRIWIRAFDWYQFRGGLG